MLASKGDKGTGSVILDYNDLWNNMTNYEGVAPGPHDHLRRPYL